MKKLILKNKYTQFVLAGVTGVLFTACSQPQNSSGTADFWSVNPPESSFELSSYDVTSAQKLVRNISDALSSVQEADLKGDLGLASELPATLEADETSINLAQSLDQSCIFESSSEKNSSNTQIQTMRWAENKNKSIRNLKDGEQLVPCPVTKVYSEVRPNNSNYTSAGELLSKSQINLSLKFTNFLKRENENGAIVYKPIALTPILSLEVERTGESLIKNVSAGDIRTIGKNTQRIDTIYKVTYTEGSETKYAEVVIKKRVLTNTKYTSDKTSSSTGRQLQVLWVKMDNKIVSVEDSTTLNGSLDSDTYTKVNGKSKRINGKPVTNP